MTDKIYEQATELRRTKKILEEVHRIMTSPYPEFNIFKPKPKFSFLYKSGGRLNVDFAELDNETRKQLQEAILHVVGKRIQEIVEELQQL